MERKERSIILTVFRGVLLVMICMASIGISAGLLMGVLKNNSEPSRWAAEQNADYALMDRFDMAMTNAIASSLDGILSIEKVYWLSDREPVAPEPNQALFGETDDPAQLQWLLDEAAKLLDGQSMYFSAETKILPGSKVVYYLDETILAITWKEKIDLMCYTISEIKIAHPSQFRRFLAGGEYGSAIQLTTTEMSESVNAVVASAGDFYKYRRAGVIVCDGRLQRMESTDTDICYVDDRGNLRLVKAEELSSEEEVIRFIEENHIRFSLAFGPILIRDGVRCEPESYPLGEIIHFFSRAGIGQRDELHYIVTTVNKQYYDRVPNIWQFAAAVERFGCDQFYTLDGGQTATIVMNDMLINDVDYGSERKISDIIYFATAVPDGG